MSTTATKVSTFELPNLSESLGTIDWIFLQSRANKALLSTATYFALDDKSHSVKGLNSYF